MSKCQGLGEYKQYRVYSLKFAYLWLTWNEGMEKMETTVTRDYTRETIRTLSVIPCEPE